MSEKIMIDDNTKVLSVERQADGSAFVRIANADGVHTLVTSASSTAAIDDIVILYSDALKRLADK